MFETQACITQETTVTKKVETKGLLEIKILTAGPTGILLGADPLPGIQTPVAPTPEAAQVLFWSSVSSTEHTERKPLDPSFGSTALQTGDE